jgi:hypothetical protein
LALFLSQDSSWPHYTYWNVWGVFHIYPFFGSYKEGAFWGNMKAVLPRKYPYTFHLETTTQQQQRLRLLKNYNIGAKESTLVWLP